MGMYRKKPVRIEARQLVGSNTEIHDVYLWVESHVGSFDPLSEYAPAKGVSIDPATGFVLIATLEGVMQAKPGDWIIKGVEGEFYPCKPEIFEKTYEDSEGEPTRWWRVVLEDGTVWCETSSESEARESVVPESTLQRLWWIGTENSEWRDQG